LLGSNGSIIFVKFKVLVIDCCTDFHTCPLCSFS
jgi:hypothetical protein